MPTPLEKAARFRQLHERQQLFVIANAWDAGTAKLFSRFGFEALGTTSAGLAFSLGRPDAAGVVTREEALANAAAIAGATRLPVTADLEAGYGASPAEVAETIREAIALGLAGASIEDATYDPAQPLHDIADGVERIQAARAAIDASGSPFVLTARSECYLTGHKTPLQEAVTRLTLYAEAGADCLYAPGIAEREDIDLLVRAVPRPVNVLMGSPDMPVVMKDLQALGVRRVSVGAAIARAALGAALRAAAEIAKAGSFGFGKQAATFSEINDVFAGEG
ncbi:MAG: isocitrate lyase/phosphoenolpyruvate mutase family protein [Rhodospirillaceae bacterium]|nr:isocitrate lyase/phosphoenolpyruvate mutase family protein [Rhodospirillaceae bacterium]